MNLPSREECYHLLREHKLTDGMLAHTEMVTKISNYLAEKLSEAGEEIDSELVDRGAILHDVAKYISLDSDVAHGRIGADIVREHGYADRLAEVVENHALEMIVGGNLKHWEDKLVYYADKRVNHADVVSLEERFDYLLERYGTKSMELKEKIIASRPYVFKLEEEIFSRIDVKPELRDLK